MSTWRCEIFVLEPVWRGGVLGSACGPCGTAGSHGTSLPCLCSYPSRRNVQKPSTWWHIYQSGPRHRWPVHLWHQGSHDAPCHVAQQAGPLDPDSPHCQGGGLTGLQHAGPGDLVARHPAVGDHGGDCTSATPHCIKSKNNMPHENASWKRARAQVAGNAP
jgi:hypothetical protein